MRIGDRPIRHLELHLINTVIRYRRIEGARKQAVDYIGWGIFLKRMLPAFPILILFRMDFYFELLA